MLEKQKEDENKLRSTRILLMQNKTIEQRVNEGGELAEVSKQYAGEFKAHSEKIFGIRRVLCYLGMAAGVLGLLVLPAAYELIHSRVLLPLPARCGWNPRMQTCCFQTTLSICRQGRSASAFCGAKQRTCVSAVPTTLDGDACGRRWRQGAAGNIETLISGTHLRGRPFHVAQNLTNARRIGYNIFSLNTPREDECP